MKKLLFALLLFTSPVFGTQLGMRFVYIPIYIKHNAVDFANPHKVSFVSHSSYIDSELSWMRRPHIPHHDSGWKKPTDVNLISLYAISIDIESIANSKNKLFVIDISKAVEPDGIPFSLQQIVDLIKESARLNFPDTDASKIIFKLIDRKSKTAEQDAGGKGEKRR